jgi:hypothetical protein
MSKHLPAALYAVACLIASWVNLRNPHSEPPKKKTKPCGCTTGCSHAWPRVQVCTNGTSGCAGSREGTHLDWWSDWTDDNDDIGRMG